MKVLHTIELEPVTGGTTIHIRFAAPKTRREREAMQVMGPAYGQALESAIPSLIAQPDAELSAREADRGPEPGLSTPRPDGIFSQLEPLVIP